MTARTRLLAGLAIACAALPLRAEDAPPPGGYDLGASITAGYRTVDIDGSKDKYREDYNLRSGLRLFTFDTEGTARDPATAKLDRFHLLVDSPGDEPTSTFHLSAADDRHWDLRANFVRSKYFYAVPQLFESPVPGDSRLDDLHDFNEIRTNGSVDFRITPEGLPTFFAGYRLYRLEGDAISTVNVPGADTFTVRAPEDTRAHVGRVGTEFHALGTDVYLAEEYRRVIREFGGHGPIAGQAAGVDPTDLSTLDHYTSFGGEHVDAPTTIVRLRRPVGDDLELTGAYLYSHATLDAAWTTRESGVASSGALLGATRRRDASATLDTNVADMGATYRLTDIARLHASYRFDERAQRGGLDEEGPAGFLTIGTGHHLRLHRVTIDGEIEPRPDLTLRAGARYAWRDANISSGIGAVQTRTLGAIADVRYRPHRTVDGFLRYESAQVDDPYRTAGDPFGRPPIPGREIALTFTNRGSAGVNVRPWRWARLAYRFVADSRENSTFDARREAFGNSVAITLTPVRDLDVLASYARRDVDNQADVLLAPRFARTLSLQSGVENVLVGRVTYDFTLAGQRWASGCHVTYVASDDGLRPRLEVDRAGRTRFALDRVDGAVFLTWRHRWIEPSVEVRVVDYAEPVLPRNDYRATIVTMSLTRRFGTAAIE